MGEPGLVEDPADELQETWVTSGYTEAVSMGNAIRETHMKHGESTV